MTNKPLTVIRDSLQVYADRGVFRGFSEVKAGAGKLQFKFVWLLQHQMDLNVDAERGALKFERLLPEVPAQSALYAELKEFIRARHDAALPEHRRIDRKRATASCANRGGAVSLTLKIKNDEYAYGVNRLVNLVHELFLYLRETQPEYLTQAFNLPEE